MNDLTATELKVLNNLSRKYNSGVFLGQEVQDLISSLSRAGTPVNAVESTMDLTLTGVVIHGETVSVDNPSISGADVYEFLADVAQVKTLPGNIAVDISADVVKAVVTLTIDTQVTSGATMTIAGVVYTFVPDGTANAAGEISVGTDLATGQAAIVAAINGTDGVNVAHPLVSAGDFAADDSVITVFIGGTAGNAFTVEETFVAATNVFSGATFASGADCTAADAITALVTAVTADDTQGVAGADETGDVISLTADVAGVSGDAIEIAETLANGAFTGAATELAGGVDGTVALAGVIMVDSSYLYYADADNPVSGKNWTRTALTFSTF